MDPFFSLIMKRISIIHQYTTCSRLVGRCACLCQHHIHLHVDWGKFQVLAPEPHRSVQRLLSAAPPFICDRPSMTTFTRKIQRVGIYTSPVRKTLYLHWPCRNLPTPAWRIGNRRDLRNHIRFSSRFVVSQPPFVNRYSWCCYYYIKTTERSPIVLARPHLPRILTLLPSSLL
jgi:hypothetical protein